MNIVAIATRPLTNWHSRIHRIREKKEFRFENKVDFNIFGFTKQVEPRARDNLNETRRWSLSKL